VVDPLHFEVWVVFSSEIFSIGGELFVMVDTFPPLRIRRRFEPIGPGKLIFVAWGKSRLVIIALGFLK